MEGEGLNDVIDADHRASGRIAGGRRRGVRSVPGLKADASVPNSIRLLAQSFKLAQIESAEADARLLIGHALHLGRAQLVAERDRLLEAREVNVVCCSPHGA